MTGPPRPCSSISLSIAADAEPRSSPIARPTNSQIQHHFHSQTFADIRAFQPPPPPPSTSCCCHRAQLTATTPPSRWPPSSKRSTRRFAPTSTQITSAPHVREAKSFFSCPQPFRVPSSDNPPVSPDDSRHSVLDGIPKMEQLIALGVHAIRCFTCGERKQDVAALSDQEMKPIAAGASRGRGRQSQSPELEEAGPTGDCAFTSLQPTD